MNRLIAILQCTPTTSLQSELATRNDVIWFRRRPDPPLCRCSSYNNSLWQTCTLRRWPGTVCHQHYITYSLQHHFPTSAHHPSFNNYLLACIF